MSISSLFQFIIGFFLGIIFFTAGIAGGAYFFLTNINANPEKHIFAEEKSSPEKEKTQTKTETKTDTKTTAEKTEPEKTAEKTEPKQEELPAGAYFAKVTWSNGLSLRSEPTKEAQRVGGVGYNTKLIVLSTSEDGKWQKIRVPGSEQEAWIKGGNVAKIDNQE